MFRTLVRWIKAHDVLTFFVLTFLITFGTWIPLVLTLPQRDMQYMTGGGRLLMLIGLWGPALSAILTAGITQGKVGLKDLFRRLLLWRVPGRWFLVVILGYPVLILLTGLLFSQFTNEPIRFNWSSWSMILALPSFSLLLQGYFANEELGWRGFALPRMLGRWNALSSSIVLGVIWGFWHMPYFWGIKGISQPFPFHIFLVYIVSISILMTWVFNHTKGSVLIAMIFHILINFIPNYVIALLSLTNIRGFYNAITLVYVAAAILVVTLSGYRTFTGDRESQVPVQPVTSET